MIRITESIDNGVTELRLEGHAEYAERGKDIVCAAVSTLVCTLVANLEDIGCEMKQDGDTVTVRCVLWDEESHTIWDAFTKGLYLTAENYPLYVEFK